MLPFLSGPLPRCVVIAANVATPGSIRPESSGMRGWHGRCSSREQASAARRRSGSLEGAFRPESCRAPLGRAKAHESGRGLWPRRSPCGSPVETGCRHRGCTGERFGDMTRFPRPGPRNRDRVTETEARHARSLPHSAAGEAGGPRRDRTDDLVIAIRQLSHASGLPGRPHLDSEGHSVAPVVARSDRSRISREVANLLQWSQEVVTEGGPGHPRPSVILGVQSMTR